MAGGGAGFAGLAFLLTIARLGITVAEALRTDLAQSSSLNVLTRASVRDLPGLLQRPAQSGVRFELPREIARR